MRELTIHPPALSRETTGSHFFTNVQNNGQFVKVAGESEANLYPLPYLFLDDSGTLAGKMNTVNGSAEKLQTFAWLLHSAASSAISPSMQCSDSEVETARKTRGAISCGLVPAERENPCRGVTFQGNPIDHEG